MSFVHTFTNKFVKLNDLDIDKYKNHYSDYYYQFAKKIMNRCSKAKIKNYKSVYWKYHDISYIKPGDFVRLIYKGINDNNLIYYYGFIINIYTHENNNEHYDSYNIYVFANHDSDCQMIKNISYNDDYIDFVSIPKEVIINTIKLHDEIEEKRSDSIRKKTEMLLRKILKCDILYD